MKDSDKLSRADFPFWRFPVKTPQCGVKLGTPQTGLMAWGDGRKIILSIGMPGLWDHDGGAQWCDEQRYELVRRMLESGDSEGMRKAFLSKNGKTPQLMPFGRIEINLPKGEKIDFAKLDVAKGALLLYRKSSSSPAMKVVVDRESDAIAIKLSAQISRSVVRCIPAWDQPANREPFERRGFTAPERFEDGFEQALPHDDAAALAIVRKGLGIVAAPVRAHAGKAHGEAVKKARALADLGFGQLRKRTATYWEGFWSNMAKIDIPSKMLRDAYEYGLFQFGAATDSRAGSMVAPLQGPWYADDCLPPWGGDYHFNINIQEYYWPAFHAGPIENLRPLLDMLSNWTPKLRHNAKVFLGIDDGIMLPHATDDHGTVMSAAFWTGMMDHGSTMWMADFFWKYYAYGGKGGKKFLREKALPFMKGAFNVFWKMLDRKPDGSLCLPIGTSPEYGGANLDAWGRNSSFQLACAHRLAENLESAAEILGEAPDPRLADLRKNLPIASIGKTSLFWGDCDQILLWDGKPLEESHRHHSHLAGIFPFDVIDTDDPGWHKTLSVSIARWMDCGYVWWSGWCVPWASIIQSRIGNADAAEFLLELWNRFFVNDGLATLHDANSTGVSMIGQPALARDSTPNKQFREIIQFDAAGGAVMAICEMLIQERRGVVHLFNGAPSRWLDVSFKGMRTLGGVLVSARRKNGVVAEVKLEAAADAAEISLADPWSLGAVRKIALKAGQTAVIRPPR